MSDMKKWPKPPETYSEFVEKYPKLGRAWSLIGEAGLEGPLSAREARLVKLGVAIGALREGAVHSSVRKALAEGLIPEDVEQVIALAASSLGLPATVAAYTWARDTIGQR